MNDPSTQHVPTTNNTSSTDPVVALDELIAKAKAKRASIAQQAERDSLNSGENESTAPEEPADPTSAEIQAQQLADLAVKEAAAAEENQRLLLEHQEKMQGLAETPQYQARKTQNEEAAKQQEEQQAAQQGHVINQIGDAKV